MPVLEAIILAGGLGTRLSSLVSNLPKAMVDVGGHPFLEILLDRIGCNGVGKAILATGFLHESIENHFGPFWRGMQILYSVENHPLGTGGAVWKALKLASEDDVFVFNGDTFFDIDLLRLYALHQSIRADVTLALKPMRHFDRYGTVELKDGFVAGFREKARTDRGLINGGVCLLSRRTAARLAFPEKFSFESDFLEKKVGEITIAGLVHDGYFIDIGVPEDYARAQQELPRLRNEAKNPGPDRGPKA